MSRKRSSGLSRRDFVKKSGGLVIATGVAAACGGGDGLTNGTVIVSITGLPGGATDFGSATVQRTDIAGQPVIPIPSLTTGSGQVDVPQGSYHIIYTAPSGYQVNGPTTFDLEVLAGQQAHVDIALTAIVVNTNGTLRVSVTGLGAAPNGGIASLLRTDIAGQNAIQVNVPVSGTVDTVVTAGTWQVTYTPPGGYLLGNGVNNPQSVNVAAGATVTASYSVIVSGFQTPDVKNNASFETDFDGFSSWAPPNPPTGVTRDTTKAFAGATAVLKVLPPTNSDLGSQFAYSLPSHNLPSVDRLWTRFYFFLDTHIDGGIKFSRYFDAGFNVQFSGLGLGGSHFSDGIGFRLDPEVSAVGGTDVKLISLATVIGAWHSIEVDYWRNGDTSNGGNDYPSAAFWLDGTQITAQLGTLPTGFSWVNGRLNAGRRNSTVKIGVWEMIGLLNGLPSNTINGNIWVDKVSISTVGRIGP